MILKRDTEILKRVKLKQILRKEDTEMMKNKILQLMAFGGKTKIQYANEMNILPQALTRRINSKWFLKDLIQLADSTETTLCFIDKQGNIVVAFDKSDIPVEE